MKTPTKKSECRQIVQDYLRHHNPYEAQPPLGYNIAAMSRYAKEKNLKLAELSKAEAVKFAVSYATKS